jgi:hypothetical protein
MRFAHLKTHHRFERMRLRDLSGARDEFHLAAILQNLRRLRIIFGPRLQPNWFPLVHKTSSVSLLSSVVEALALGQLAPHV